MSKVRRRLKGGAKEVMQPHLIDSYNKKDISGVDLMTVCYNYIAKRYMKKMVLDLVHKISQCYSHCSMEDILPTWQAKDISLGVSKTGDSLLASSR